MSDERVVVHVNTVEPERQLAPCEMGVHRWAWLTNGGQACGYCGVSRR